jgi:hypothetical protein
MVVLLDLDEDPTLFHDESAYDLLKHQLRGPLLRAGNTQDALSNPAPSESTSEERPNPNLNGFSAALSCYP